MSSKLSGNFSLMRPHSQGRKSLGSFFCTNPKSQSCNVNILHWEWRLERAERIWKNSSALSESWGQMPSAEEEGCGGRCSWAAGCSQGESNLACLPAEPLGLATQCIIPGPVGTRGNLWKCTSTNPHQSLLYCISASLPGDCAHTNLHKAVLWQPVQTWSSHMLDKYLLIEWKGAQVVSGVSFKTKSSDLMKSVILSWVK